MSASRRTSSVHAGSGNPAGPLITLERVTERLHFSRADLNRAGAGAAAPPSYAASEFIAQTNAGRPRGSDLPMKSAISDRGGNVESAHPRPASHRSSMQAPPRKPNVTANDSEDELEQLVSQMGTATLRSSPMEAPEMSERRTSPLQAHLHPSQAKLHHSRRMSLAQEPPQATVRSEMRHPCVPEQRRRASVSHASTHSQYDTRNRSSKNGGIPPAIEQVHLRGGGIPAQGRRLSEVCEPSRLHAKDIPAPSKRLSQIRRQPHLSRPSLTKGKSQAAAAAAAQRCQPEAKSIKAFSQAPSHIPDAIARSQHPAAAAKYYSSSSSSTSSFVGNQRCPGKLRYKNNWVHEFSCSECELSQSTKHYSIKVAHDTQAHFLQLDQVKVRSCHMAVSSERYNEQRLNCLLCRVCYKRGRNVTTYNQRTLQEHLSGHEIEDLERYYG